MQHYADSPPENSHLFTKLTRKKNIKGHFASLPSSKTHHMQKPMNPFKQAALSTCQLPAVL